MVRVLLCVSFFAMDVVHHALIGGVGYTVAAAGGQEVAGMAFVAASVAPDMDVAFMALGKRAYLRNHQAITHSLPLLPLYALLIAAPLWWLLGVTGLGSIDWLIFVAAAAGLLLHIGLDLTNTFGIAALSPLSKKRFSYDAVFFVDSVALGMTGAFYAVHITYGPRLLPYLYFASFAAYVAFKVALQRRVVKRLSAEFAVPSALHPFEFYIMKRLKCSEGGGENCSENYSIDTFLYNALSGKSRAREHFAPIGERYMELAMKSTLYNDMARITRALTVVSADESPDGGVTLTARDLAVRNFGGRFGRTVVTFDKEGRLLSEVADI